MSQGHIVISSFTHRLISYSWVVMIVIELLTFIVRLLQIYKIVNASSSFPRSIDGITGVPSLYDHWCKEHCSSLESCNRLFNGDHVDLKLKLKHSVLDGPGSYLENGRYHGDLVRRQIYETQLILDISISLDISPCAIYVLKIDLGSIGHYHDLDSVFVSFRLFDVEIDKIKDLNRQVQVHDSTFYQGKVTEASDHLVGLMISEWDFSIKLMYSIEVVSGLDIEQSDEGPIVRHGGLRSCTIRNDLTDTPYCTFEKLFRLDLCNLLNIEFNDIEVLFVKPSGEDGVMFTFRLYPAQESDVLYNTKWVKKKAEILLQLIQNPTYEGIYQGNVVFRIDPTFGISGKNGTLRSSSVRLGKIEESKLMDDYERCKMVHNCPMASSSFYVPIRKLKYSFQFYPDGKLIEVPMFLDFEDWRQGSFGLNSKDFHISEKNDSLVQGAHWSPFHYNVYYDGLVMNSDLRQYTIDEQTNIVGRLKEKMEWMDNVSKISSLDAAYRSRIDIKNQFIAQREILVNNLEKQQSIFDVLSGSHCIEIPCKLLFNSSNLVLSGAFCANGTLGVTDNGTEVAIWTFESINIDSNVQVLFTGQRAISILSRSSVYIDTKFEIHPGSLGGMPGGYSTARNVNHQLLSVCSKNTSSTKDMCVGDKRFSYKIPRDISNNVNGIGSPSLRNYEFSVTTTAEIVRRVQTIRTTSKEQHRIGGSFKLHFRNYSTPPMPYDVDPSMLKRTMEDSLNPTKVKDLRTVNRKAMIPGIGEISVSRMSHNAYGGFEWKVTFISAVGTLNNHSLTASNFLTGANATVEIIMYENGNFIGGYFALIFNGKMTRNLSHDVTPDELESSLVQDISDIVNASVTRTESVELCLDGLCANGPSQCGGHKWEIRIATTTGNISPTSPTSPDHSTEGILIELGAMNNLTGCVDNKCPQIIISRKLYSPYSLSYGGGGAGYGGKGGAGFGHNPKGRVYGDDHITDLLGGSGGALGVSLPRDVTLMGLPSRLRGGSGGGAIEIVAQNDLVLGPNAAISCNGESGFNGFQSGGGGGSGGSILIVAGGVAEVHGTLSAMGGKGGVPNSIDPLFKKYPGGGGSGGRVAIFGNNLVLGNSSRIDVSGGRCNTSMILNADGSCDGENGTIYKNATTSFFKYKIDSSMGAKGTKRSLLILGTPVNGVLEGGLRYHKEYIGPTFHFTKESRPERVSFYTRFSLSESKASTDWKYSILFSPNQLPNKDFIGLKVSFGTSVTHGEVIISSNERFLVPKNIKSTSITINFDQWIKIDVKFNWESKTYSVYFDDVSIVIDFKLSIDSIAGVGISATRSNVNAWFDEIYAGIDGGKGFVCPFVNDKGEVEIPFGEKRNRDWSATEKGSKDRTYSPMNHHESHLFTRGISQMKYDGEIDFFDGSGHLSYSSDVKHQWKTRGNKVLQPGHLLEIEVEARKKIFYWYGEYHSARGTSFGGIGSCSTSDMKTWKYNGVVLRNANVTDMVRGYPDILHVERPRVIFNSKTRKYVMWFIVDNENRSLAMTGVATSDHAEGPFTFIRSFYPDGNKTRDSHIFVDHDAAYLIRTFYDTIEYILPSPEMGPIWESVKSIDGSINFGLSYHRAVYHSDYDDFHDIYMQRWRKEDVPWKVLCVDKMNGFEREIPFGASGELLCRGPYEEKIVLGQGDPTTGPVKSRYLDPSNLANNVWKPNSIPNVQSQTWKSNYENQLCGVQKSRQDIDEFDPILDNLQKPDRGSCSTIVDNPIHGTDPDQLRGKARVVEKRTAKFISVSKLTYDFLDTSGLITVYEGELQDGADLGFLVSQAKQEFGWNTDVLMTSTSNFFPPITSGSFHSDPHSNSRTTQYRREYNDLAEYSVASLDTSQVLP